MWCPIDVSPDEEACVPPAVAACVLRGREKWRPAPCVTIPSRSPALSKRFTQERKEHAHSRADCVNIGNILGSASERAAPFVVVALVVIDSGNTDAAPPRHDPYQARCTAGTLEFGDDHRSRYRKVTLIVVARPDVGGENCQVCSGMVPVRMRAVVVHAFSTAHP